MYCDHYQITVTFLTYLPCKRITLKVRFFFSNMIRKFNKKDQDWHYNNYMLCCLYLMWIEVQAGACMQLNMCQSLNTPQDHQWANITYPCLGFALTPRQRSKHNTHRTPRSHRQQNNTSTNNSQQNPPKKNQQEQKKTLLKNWHVYSEPLCVCSFADLIIIISLSLPPNGVRQWGQLVVVYL